MCYPVFQQNGKEHRNNYFYGTEPPVCGPKHMLHPEFLKSAAAANNGSVYHLKLDEAVVLLHYKNAQ